MESPADVPTSQRWRPNVPLLVAGGVSIVAGGLIAALTGPTDWDDGSWVAAFCVLVTGVAQIGLGAAQAHLSPVAADHRFVAAEGAAWNGGGLVILAGTLLESPAVTTAGSALLVAALVMSTVVARGPARRPGLLLWAYRAMLVVLLVSTPIGIALAWARHS